MQNLKHLALAVLLISLTIAPAYAQRHGGGSPFDHEGKKPGQIERLKQALKLTPQQEAELKVIHTERQEKTAILREEVGANRVEIRNIFDAEVFDERRLRELTRKQSELRADMMVGRHVTREQVNQILTPEQQKKHEELRKQRMANKGNRRCGESATGTAKKM